MDVDNDTAAVCSDMQYSLPAACVCVITGFIQWTWNNTFPSFSLISTVCYQLQLCLRWSVPCD